MENLESLVFILGGVLLGLNGFYIVTYFRKKAGVGGVQLLSLQSIMYTDFFTQSIFIMPFLTIFVVNIFTGEMSDFLGSINLSYAMLYAGMIFYLVNTLIQTFTKKGFYDNGVVTSKGILYYDEITSYNFGMDYKAKKMRVTFNSNGKGANTMYIVLDDEYQDAVKAFLRKHINLRQNMENIQTTGTSIFKSRKKRQQEVAAAEEAKKGIKPPTPKKKKKRKK